MADNDNQQLVEITKEQYNYFMALERGGKRRFVFYAILVTLVCGISTYAGYEVGRSKCIDTVFTADNR